MNTGKINITIAMPTELPDVGIRMADVYSRLDGFPSEEDQPSYYKQFYSLGDLTDSNSTDVVIAKNQHGEIAGGVVFFTEMRDYGAGGEATTSIKNAAAIRLLFVSPDSQGQGIGRKLTEHCIELAKRLHKSRMILHTTQFMPAAWKLYEHMGFTRYPAIDFKQSELDVFGFQLPLSATLD